MDRAISDTGNLWVHTTSILDGEVRFFYKLPNTYNIEKCIQAPNASILIPRVGKFDVNKIVINPRSDDHIISDCLFSIYSDDDATMKNLREIFSSKINEIIDLYYGTGAPYTTVNKIKTYLLKVLGEIRD